MSISRKLKDLIVAFGGAQNAAAIPGSRIDKLIGTLAEVADEKKALHVVLTEGDNGPEASETISDIVDAALADRPVDITHVFNGVSLRAYISQASHADGEDMCIFCLNIVNIGEEDGEESIDIVPAAVYGINYGSGDVWMLLPTA